MTTIARPGLGDHAPYYGRYVEQVTGDDVLATLEAQVEETAALLAAIPPSAESFAYAPGKWSFREVAGHLVDTERVFAFRCLHMARGDRAPLPGMEQDEWAAGSNAGARPLPDHVDDLRAVRHATLTLLRGLDEAAFERRGSASGVEFAVRAFPWIVAGHERHHLTILRERYLPALEKAAPEGSPAAEGGGTSTAADGAGASAR
ncbi:MAG TPA: DinB family protein [Longimicrobiales bacterium]|nr:DinB family protein [Longimicrobiales bacterium]